MSHSSTIAGILLRHLQLADEGEREALQAIYDEDQADGGAVPALALDDEHQALDDIDRGNTGPAGATSTGAGGDTGPMIAYEGIPEDATTVAQVTAWVDAADTDGEAVARARAALRQEQASDSPRSTLVEQLQNRIDEGA